MREVKQDAAPPDRTEPPRGWYWRANAERVACDRGVGRGEASGGGGGRAPRTHRCRLETRPCPLSDCASAGVVFAQALVGIRRLGRAFSGNYVGKRVTQLVRRRLKFAEAILRKRQQRAA